MRRILIFIIVPLILSVSICGGNSLITLEGTFVNSEYGLISGIKTVTVRLVNGANLSGGDEGEELWVEAVPKVMFDNGFMSMELGRRNKLAESLFERKSISFLVKIEGVNGLVSIPIRYVPRTLYATTAGEAKRVPAVGIDGVIGSKNIQGEYSGITGLGVISRPLTIKTSVAINESQLVIDESSGFVGVGLKNPESRLDVQGDMRMRGKIIFPDGTTLNSTKGLSGSASSIKSEGSVIVEVDKAQNQVGDFQVLMGGTAYLKVLNNGRTGIGVKEPRQRLDVNGAIRIGDTNDNVEGTIRYHDNMYEGYDKVTKSWQRLDIEPTAAGGWTPKKSNSQVVLTYPLAKVGLGVSDPEEKLEVEGAIKATDFKGRGKSLTEIQAGAIEGVMGVSQGGLGVGGYDETGILYYSKEEGTVRATGPLLGGQIMMGSGSGIPEIYTIESGEGVTINIEDRVLRIGHSDRSEAVSANNEEGIVIQKIGLDRYGHIERIESLDLDERYYSQEKGDERYLSRAGGVVAGALEFKNVDVAIKGGENEDIIIEADGTGRVGIGQKNPITMLDVGGGIRVGNSDVDVMGAIRFNTESQRIEGRNSKGWVPLDKGPTESGRWDNLVGSTVYSEPDKKLGIGVLEPEHPLHITLATMIDSVATFNKQAEFKEGLRVGDLEIKKNGIKGDLVLEGGVIRGVESIYTEGIGIGLIGPAQAAIDVSGNIKLKGELQMDNQTSISAGVLKGAWSMSGGRLEDVSIIGVGKLRLEENKIESTETINVNGAEGVILESAIKVKENQVEMIQNKDLEIEGYTGKAVIIEGVQIKDGEIRQVESLEIKEGLKVATSQIVVNEKGVGIGREPEDAPKLAIEGDVVIGTITDYTDGDINKSDLYIDGNLVINGDISHKGGTNRLTAIEVKGNTVIAKESGRVQVGSEEIESTVGITRKERVGLEIQDENKNIQLQLKEGRLGVGVGAGKGILELKGGTLTVPPLIFNKGIKTHQHIAGALEYDGTDLWITTETLTRNQVVNTTEAQSLERKTLVGATIRNSMLEGNISQTGPVKLGDAGQSLTIESSGYRIESDGDVEFKTAAVNRLTVTENAIIKQDVSMGGLVTILKDRKQVGVGITNPSNNATMQVMGTVLIGQMPSGQTAAADKSDLKVRGSVHIEGDLKQVDGKVEAVSVEIEKNLKVGTSGGMLGVGESAPDAMLDILGNQDSGASKLIEAKWNNQDKLILTTTGKMGIGRADPQAELHVSGDIRANNYYGDGSNLTGLGTVWNEDETDGTLRYMKNKIGIQQTTPKGYLHIGANTEAEGSLIIDPGAIKVTNPEIGLIEYIKNDTEETMYFTKSTGRESIILSEASQILMNKTLKKVQLGGSGDKIEVVDNIGGNKWSIHQDGNASFEGKVEVSELNSRTNLVLSANGTINMWDGLVVSKNATGYEIQTDKALHLKNPGEDVYLGGIRIVEGKLEGLKDLSLDEGLKIEGNVVATSDVFRINGTQLVVKKGSQGIGIGVENPSVSLDIKGEVKATRFIGDGSGLSNLDSVLVQDAVTKAVHYTEGNFGIGESNPIGKLHVGSGSETEPSLIIKESGQLTTAPISGGIEHVGGKWYVNTDIGRYPIIRGKLGGTEERLYENELENTKVFGTMRLEAGSKLTGAGGHIELSEGGEIKAVTVNIGGLEVTGTHLKMPANYEIEVTNKYTIKDRLEYDMSSGTETVIKPLKTVKIETSDDAISVGIEGVHIQNRNITNINDIEIGGVATLNNRLTFTDTATIEAPTNKNISIKAGGSSTLRMEGETIELSKVGATNPGLMINATNQVLIGMSTVTDGTIKLGVAGSVTANKYYGDGSGLYNLASKWEESGEKIFLTGEKQVGIGTDTPRGYLELKAGTEKPSLVLQEAPGLNSNAPAGSINYKDGSLYIRTTSEWLPLISSKGTDDLENKTIKSGKIEGVTELKGRIELTGDVTITGNYPIAINTKGSNMTVSANNIKIESNGRIKATKVELEGEVEITKDKIEKVTGEYQIKAGSAVAIQDFMKIKPDRRIEFLEPGDVTMSVGAGGLYLDGIYTRDGQLSKVDLLDMNGNINMSGTSRITGLTELALAGKLTGVSNLEVGAGIRVTGDVILNNELTASRDIRIIGDVISLKARNGSAGYTEARVSSDIFQVKRSDLNDPVIYTKAASNWAIGIGTSSVSGLSNEMVISGNLKVLGAFYADGSNIFGLDSVWKEYGDTQPPAGLYTEKSVSIAGVHHPQGHLDIGAGTAAQPALIIRNGQNVSSTKIDGAIEYTNGELTISRLVGQTSVINRHAFILGDKEGQTIKSPILEGQTEASVINMSDRIKGGTAWSIKANGEAGLKSVTLNNGLVMKENKVEGNGASIEWTAVSGEGGVLDVTGRLQVSKIKNAVGSVTIEDVVIENGAMTGVASLEVEGASILKDTVTIKKKSIHEAGLQVTGQIEGNGGGISLKAGTGDNAAIWDLTNEGQSTIKTSIFKITSTNNQTGVYVKIGETNQVGIGTENMSVLSGKSGMKVAGDIHVSGNIYGNGSNLTGMDAYKNKWILTGNQTGIYVTDLKVGIGPENPLGRLHIGATDGATPPMIFSASSGLMTNKISGALEYTDTLYLTDSSLHRSAFVLTSANQTLKNKTIKDGVINGSLIGKDSGNVESWKILETGYIESKQLKIDESGSTVTLTVGTSNITAANTDLKIEGQNGNKVQIEDVIITGNIIELGSIRGRSGAFDVGGVTFNSGVISGVTHLSVENGMNVTGTIESEEYTVAVGTSRFKMEKSSGAISAISASANTMHITANVFTIASVNAQVGAVPFFFVDAEAGKVGIGTNQVTEKGLTVVGTLKADKLVGEASELNFNDELIVKSLVVNEGVSANGTITFNHQVIVGEGIKVTGKVTANQFVGDGSQLTNVIPANSNLVTIGNLTHQANGFIMSNGTQWEGKGTENVRLALNLAKTSEAQFKTVTADRFIGDGAGLIFSGFTINGMLEAQTASINGTVKVNGGVTVNGTVTANKFVGNRVKATSIELTGGISATTMNIFNIEALGAVSVNGTVTANKFIGDGSELTAISSSSLDSDLTAIAGLTHSNGQIMVSKAGAWVGETENTARTSLGLGTDDSMVFKHVSVNGTISANRYIGEGSELTFDTIITNRVIASTGVSVNGTVTANIVKATYLYGDGSNIQGLSFANLGGSFGSSAILNGSIINEDISTGAAIQTSKLSGALSVITGHGLGTAAFANIGSAGVQPYSEMLKQIGDLVLDDQSDNDSLRFNGSKWVTSNIDATFEYNNSNLRLKSGALTAIEGLTTAGDQMLYTTGSDVYAMTTLTSVARNLLDDADQTTQQTTLGLKVGTHVQAQNTNLQAITGLSPDDGKFIVGDGTNFIVEEGSTVRNSIGLGTGDSPVFLGLSVSNTVTANYVTANNMEVAGTVTANKFAATEVAITGGTVTGITDITVADGGTGASTESAARTNLGLAIGSNVQAYDAELSALAGLTSAAHKGIQFTGTGAADVYPLTTAGKALLDDNDAAAQLVTLGVNATAAELNKAADGDTAATSTTIADADRVVVNDNGTMVQVAIADFKPYFENGIDTLNNLTSATSLASVGTIGTGIWAATDVAVDHGGTGASTAAGAATNLGLGTGDKPLFAGVSVNGTVTANKFIGEGSGLTGISSSSIGDNAIISAKIADNAVKSAKIEGNAVTSGKILNGSIINEDLAAVSFTNIKGVGTIAVGTWQGTGIAIQYGGTGASSAAAAATNLGLGTGATPVFAGVSVNGTVTANKFATAEVAITGGTVTGITDITVEDGGTGVSTLTDGGLLLGSGTGAVTAMSVLADGQMIVGDGTTDPVAESGATLRTSLGLGTGDEPLFAGVSVNGTVTANKFIGDGSGLTGVTGIANNAVTSAKIEDDTITGAQIALIDDNYQATATHMLVADGTDFDNVAMSGDASLASNGALTIASNAVTSAKIANGAIINEDLAEGTFGNITGVGTITAGTWEATDVAVLHGGTGASTLTDGGLLLGSGTGAVTAMAVLADGAMIVGDGTTDPVAEAGGTLRTSLGLGTGDKPLFAGVSVNGTVTVNGTVKANAFVGGGAGITGVTATDIANNAVTSAKIANGAIINEDLAEGTFGNITGVGTITAGTWEATDVAVLHGGTGASTLTDGGLLLGSGTGAVTAMAVLADGAMIVGDGTTDPVAESGATLRTSLGLGTGDKPLFAGVSVNGTVGIWTDSPLLPANRQAPLHVKSAATSGHPQTNGIYLFNPRNSSGDQDAIITARVGGTSAGDPYISWDVDAEGGYSMGIDNSDQNKFKISGKWDSLETDTRLTIKTDGNVGIGTTTPGQKLEVNGTVKATSFTGGTWTGTDIAVADGGTGASTAAAAATNLGLGTGDSPVFAGVSVNGTVTANQLDITGGSDFAELFTISESETLSPGSVVVIDPDRPGELMLSTAAYDRKVVGIISGANGIKPGLLMKQGGSVAEGGHPVALSGRVFVRCTSENGKIEPGDFLTTSDKEGLAMKVTDYDQARGAIIGKAMTRLKESNGYVLVLVTLQ